MSPTSGNTTEEWKSIKDSTTDGGRKSHLVTRGSGNVVITAMAGAAFVKELSEIAEKLSVRIVKVKKPDNLVDDVAKINELIRGITKSDFLKTVNDFANGT